MLEEKFYFVDGMTKRFFDKKDIEHFFHDWRIHHIEEYSINRHSKEKILWEVLVSPN